MKSLTDFVIALADLAESEVRLVRRSLVHVLLAGAMILGAAMLLMAGLVLWLVSLFVYLNNSGLGVSGAALISGVVALAMGAIVMGVAVWLGR